MDKPEYIQTLVQVATMYYTENLTQQEISTKLKTTRQNVSRFLNEAKSKGIVDIKIHNPLNDIESLSQHLKDTFQLGNAIVIPCEFEDSSLIRNVIAQRAVEYISQVIEGKSMNIGLSWGRTVCSFIRLFNFLESDSALNIFPMLGASSETSPYFMINEMVRLFAEKAKAAPHFIYIPVNPGSSEEYGLFSRTKAFHNISQLWKEIDVAIVGLGCVQEKIEASRQEYPGEKELSSSLLAKNVVGDICTNYFDINGNILKPSDYHKLISVSEDGLRKAGKVIALTGGIEKTQAIIGGLRTGLITDLLIDEKTANSVLKQVKGSHKI